MCAWSAPNYILLTTDESPLECGPLSDIEGSLVVALLSLGGLLGIFFAVSTIDRIGRKIPLLILTIPQIVIKDYFNKKLIFIENFFNFFPIFSYVYYCYM